MKVLGFNYDKISVERLKERPENFKINTNIDVADIKEIKSNILKTKEQIVNVTFNYTIKYDPGFAVIDLKGHIVLSLDEDQYKDVMKDWKKKSMSDQFRTTIFNMIMRKSSIKALELEDDLNLPLHMPFPVLRLEKTEKEK